MKSENLHLSRLQTGTAIVATLLGLQATFSGWQRRARERSELAQLDLWSQRDLGLSANDVELEVNKSRWSA
jgi:uncharacterized protein YjiS (DUF1127 family)